MAAYSIESYGTFLAGADLASLCAAHHSDRSIPGDSSRRV